MEKNTMSIQKRESKNPKAKKLYMQVYDEIRDYILEKKLGPGDKLPTEMEMCAALGISRNVLREAIKALEITGVVSSKPGVGIMIQEFNPDFLFQALFYNMTYDSEAMMDQTMAIRRVLELGFQEESFNTIESEDIERLSELVDIMGGIVKERSVENGVLTRGREFSDADAEFHLVLNGRTGNRVLLSIIDAIWRCDRFYTKSVRLDDVKLTVQRHRRIVDALREKDWDAYTAAMEEHFLRSYKMESSEPIKWS